MTKKRSRTIPKKVRQAVNERHFFECAWCGVNFTEQHHLDEFYLGGEHIEGNLILLCPTHHAMAHKGEILKSELILRKSNHKKGDRLSGNFKTTLEKSYVKFGNSFFLDSSNFLHYNGFPILDVKVECNNLLLSCRFFDPNGDLIFWMSRNMFWSTVEAKISPPSIDFIEISNPDKFFYLKVEKENDYLSIRVETYVSGVLIIADSEKILFTNGKGSFVSVEDRFTNCDWIFNLAPSR
jgi:hypothetical protein